MSKDKLFLVRTANQCMEDAAKISVPRDLYNSLVYEGELTILFADTGVGKSIFAVQMGEEMSKAKKTLYADLELSDKQFEARYSTDYRNHYRFNDNFLRANFSIDSELPQGQKYDDYIMDSLEDIIVSRGIEVLIMDNMSMLCQGDTDKGRVAKPMMAKLINLKMKHNLTMVLIDHTRKTLDCVPISKEDLQGSKMKPNLADSVIYIGKSSQGENVRYVIQLKCRSSEVIYHKDNVLVYEIVKKDSFLQFSHLRNDKESDHLRMSSSKEERNQMILDLHNQGVPNTQIAERLGLSEGAIRKVLKK